MSNATTSEAGWKWYGYAGHLCVGRHCAFHLSTCVPGYLISTVGDYRPPHAAGQMKTIGSGAADFFETFVFKCDGEDENGNPNITDWSNVDGERYADSLSAERTHYAYCRKYTRMGEQEASR